MLGHCAFRPACLGDVGTRLLGTPRGKLADQCGKGMCSDQVEVAQSRALDVVIVGLDAVAEDVLADLLRVAVP